MSMSSREENKSHTAPDEALLLSLHTGHESTLQISLLLRNPLCEVSFLIKGQRFQAFQPLDKTQY